MGSAAVYGPQKGAKVPNDVQLLDAGLGVVAQRWEEDLSVSTNVKHLPGAGAAGGLGAGLIAFCHASLCSGFDLVAEYAELDSALEAAHLVLTGEGRIFMSKSDNLALCHLTLAVPCPEPSNSNVPLKPMMSGIHTRVYWWIDCAGLMPLAPLGKSRQRLPKGQKGVEFQ
mmetsp:Transcript_30533/g.49405  ORF Transcript_30533/g.49405 Transcript_30533/m.49405 type:complete len:170 (-) Transcript_30533:690-1199(-)